VHQHIGPDTLADAVRFAQAQGIYGIVNLSGGHVGGGLEAQLAAASRFPGVVTFMNLDWEGCCDAAWLQREQDALVQGQKLGARGVKVFKSLGLYLRDGDGRIPVDSPKLDAIWELCGSLGLPVAIHVGDPKAFFEPLSPSNERWEELQSAPDWSFADRQRFPAWEVLFQEFVHLVEKHPRTKFIGVHFGNDPEDPAEVGRLLTRLPNLYVDTAARVPELGRRSEATKATLLAHPTRILFGTDLQWVSRGPIKAVVLGAGPAYRLGFDEPVKRFFGSTFRFFEGTDSAIPSPTPIQGNWALQGLGLPRDVLERIYHRNAEELLGVQIR
jgi:predicted TIM-barrel fold metal-dependent hydrolase